MTSSVRSVSFLVLATFVAACGGSAARPALDGGSTDALPPLPSGITELDGLDSDLPTDDLQALKPMIGQASVVALGESIHTSGGYHQAKSRIIRYLVDELEFRVFLMETPRMDAQPLTDYLNSCIGAAPNTDLDAAMKSIFPVFASTSSRDLFAWLCTYNQQHASDPVSFYGFDMQEPWNQGPLLRNYFTQAAPSQAATFTTSIDSCDGATTASEKEYYAQYPHGGMVSEAQRASCQNGLATVRQYMIANQSALITNSSAEKFTLALLALDGLSGWEDEVFYSANYAHSSLARDSKMAEIVEGIRTLWFPTKKALVWAHNFHIQEAGELDMNDTQGLKHMGSLLHADLQSDSFSIGLVGYQVDIDWPGVGPAPTGCLSNAPPTAADAVEKMLHDLGRPNLLVDLGFPGAPQPFFAADASYEFDGEYGRGSDVGVIGPIRQQFSALVYLDHSAAMTPLYWGACP